MMIKIELTLDNEITRVWDTRTGKDVDYTIEYEEE